MADILRPPLQNSLDTLWLQSEWQLPTVFSPVAAFNPRPLWRLIEAGPQRNLRSGVREYLASMACITGMTVTGLDGLPLSSSDDEARTVTLLGTPTESGNLPPEVAIRMARSGEQFFDCEVSIVSSSPADAELRRRRLLASIPVIVFMAEGELPAEIANQFPLGEVTDLAVAMGQTLTGVMLA